jgi:hypothetical protein
VRLVVGVRYNFRHQIIQGHPLESYSFFVGLHRRQSQQLPNELVEPLRLALDAIEMGHHPGVGIVARKFESHTRPRQGRPQLMRNIAKQHLLCVHERFEAFSHVIEVVHKSVELVPMENRCLSILFYPRTQTSHRKLTGGFTQIDHRARENHH